MEMAQQTKRKSASKGSKSGRGRNRSAMQKKLDKGSVDGERQNEIRNQGSDKTVPERMYEDYTLMDPVEISDTDEPDVIVDIPVVKVDEIHFELDDFMARISLHAEAK